MFHNGLVGSSLWLVFFQVINEVEALAHDKVNEPSFGTENADVQDVGSGDLNAIHRTAKRISLTCRLVLKVHKNIFKF